MKKDVHWYLPKDLVAVIVARAKVEHRPVSSQVQLLLEAALRAERASPA